MYKYIHSSSTLTSLSPQCVRWSLLPQSYIAKEVVNEPVLKDYLAVKDMIINALIYHLDNHPDTGKQNRRFFPRHPSSLVVVRGFLYFFSCRCTCFLLFNSSFVTRFRVRIILQLMLIRLKTEMLFGCYHTRPITYYLKFDFFLTFCTNQVGGKNPTVRDTVESYSAKNNSWRPLAKLTVKRSSVGVAFLNGYLYAVG